MVLIEVCKLIVKQNSRFKVCWKVELDDTLLLGREIGDGAVIAVIKESITWLIGIGVLLILSIEAVCIFV